MKCYFHPLRQTRYATHVLKKMRCANDVAQTWILRVDVTHIRSRSNNRKDRREALLSFVNNVADMEMDFREAFRLSLLKDMLGLTKPE